MTMIEVRITPSYSQLDHAAFFFPCFLLPLLVLFYISYIAVSRCGKLAQWTVLFILSYGRKQSRSAAGSNSFYFLEPHHHVGRLESKYPPSGSAVLKQQDWKKEKAEMSGSFRRRKDRHWLLTEWDLLLATFSHDTTTGLKEIRSVAITEVNDTVLWD